MRSLLLVLLFFVASCSSVEVKTPHFDNAKPSAPAKSAKTSAKKSMELKMTQAQAQVVNKNSSPTGSAAASTAAGNSSAPSVSTINPTVPSASNSGAKIVGVGNLSYSQRQERVGLLLAEGKNLDAVRETVLLSNIAPTTEEKEAYAQKSIKLTSEVLNKQDLTAVADGSEFGIARAAALIKRGDSARDVFAFEDAQKNYQAVIANFPNSEFAKVAQKNLDTILSSRGSDPKVIGVILPLSGKGAGVAKRAQRAIELGLGITDKTSNFKLVIADDGDNPEVATAAVNQLVGEQNAIAIVGSVSSKTALAVAKRANELSIPNISLSQKIGITEIGPYSFRNSLTSETQVQYLVKTAMSRGLKRFAIVYPNDNYGVEYANQFWDAVLARGGEIRAAQSYPPAITDFRYITQRLIGTYYTEARAEEFKAKSFLMAEAAKTKTTKKRENTKEDVLDPIVDFDAVFIPDNTKAMGQIAAFLRFNGVEDVKLLGTNLWNTPDVSQRAGNYSKNLIFVDSYVPNSFEVQNSFFTQTYKRYFTDEPGPIDFQAYDSALILRKLINEGATTREQLAKKISEMSRMEGSLSPLTTNKFREIRRPLQCLSLSSDGTIQAL